MTAGRGLYDEAGSAASDCRACALLAVCGQPSSSVAVAPLRGWSLATAAVGFFFPPLFIAIGGALLGGPSPTGQLLGGLFGLAVGMLVALLVGRLVSQSLCDRSSGGPS